MEQLMVLMETIVVRSDFRTRWSTQLNLKLSDGTVFKFSLFVKLLYTAREIESVI